MFDRKGKLYSPNCAIIDCAIEESAPFTIVSSWLYSLKNCIIHCMLRTENPLFRNNRSSSPRTSVARFSCPNHLHLDFAATYLQYPNTFGAFLRWRHKSLVVGQPIPAAWFYEAVPHNHWNYLPSYQLLVYLFFSHNLLWYFHKVTLLFDCTSNSYNIISYTHYGLSSHWETSFLLLVIMLSYNRSFLLAFL